MRHVLAFILFLPCTTLSIAWDKNRDNAVDVFEGRLTPIESSIQGAISNRHQEHMWITEDGGLHLLVAGDAYQAHGLKVYSTYDSGNTWIVSLEILETASRPKADALFHGGFLYLLYPGISGELTCGVFVQSEDGFWEHQRQHVIFDGNGTTVARRATLTMDMNMHLWVALTAQEIDSGRSVIRVGMIDDAGQLTLLDRNFGTVNRSERKSARIHALDQGLVLIYTDSPNEEEDRHVLNISYCPSVMEANVWVDSSIFDYSREDSAKDRYGAHFNALIDSQGLVQIVTVSQGKLLHIRWSRQTPDLPLFKQYGKSNPYMQIASSSDGSLYIAASANLNLYHDVVTLLRSDNFGETFEVDSYLVYDPKNNLGKSRLEMPVHINTRENSTGFPLIRQVEIDDGRYGFVSFL